MRSSIFNLRVPLASGDLFLMNTLSDGQIIVSSDVVRLLDRLRAGAVTTLTTEEQETLAQLQEHGFIVESDDAEREALEAHFRRFREDSGQLRVTVLTTLACNCRCDYCFQGEAGAAKASSMSLETARRVVTWIERRLDDIAPSQLSLTFFGGEPLLNLPVLFELSERAAAACTARGVRLLINLITNGVLLTPQIVDRLVPLGLNGVKVTLDGDRETHDRHRPRRGGQGTFDRIIANRRRVAGRTRIAIGGNFDLESLDRYPALLDFLREQDFAPAVSRITFKPVIHTRPAPGAVDGVIPLAPADAATGGCMSTAGAGGSVCDTCGFVDEAMERLRRETERHGFKTVDGVHMGPCELHKRHAHTIGPDGMLYACPGFTGDQEVSIGSIDGDATASQAAMKARFANLASWKRCGDCSFIPVCGGGCAVAARAELGDVDAPSCHKRAFEAALISLAERAAGIPSGGIQ